MGAIDMPIALILDQQNAEWRCRHLLSHLCMWRDMAGAALATYQLMNIWAALDCKPCPSDQT